MLKIGETYHINVNTFMGKKETIAKFNGTYFIPGYTMLIYDFTTNYGNRMRLNINEFEIGGFYNED